MKVTLPLAIVALCFFEFTLHRQNGIFREYEAAFLSLQWMLFACIAIWSGTFLFLTFSLNDLPLTGLLVIAIAAYFISAQPALDALTLLAGVTLGKGARLLFRQNEEERKKRSENDNISEIVNPKSTIVNFLLGLVVLLAFSSWWHLDMTNNYYHGPRWMGLWDNPNIYGMLMGAGFVLTIGLLAQRQKVKGKMEKFLPVFLFIAAGMMGVGLVMSYSRGAWLATAMGLLYLTWYYGRLKWRYVLPAVAVIGILIGCFWSRTPDSAPWYVKRMDFGRPSAQHRVAAWKACFEMMRDHPFGVGWNNAISTFEKKYSPPEAGAPAITMNSYLMIGTELGIPALVCFIVYVALQLGVGSWQMEDGTEKLGIQNLEFEIKTACRAGTIVLLVAFWFDGGLFTLATSAVFWILLELGANTEGRIMK